MKTSLYLLVLILLSGVAVAHAKGSNNARLIDASEAGEVSAVRELLSAGVSVNAQSAVGKTPLMFAAGEGQIEVVRVLLENGANPSAIDKDGDVAADHATKTHHPEVEALLRDAMQ